MLHMADKKELTPKQKKGCLIGCLAPIVIIAVILIIAFTIDTINNNEEENEAEEKIEWVSVEEFEITDNLDLETKVLYTVLNIFTPEERVTNTGAPILEKEMTLGTEIKIKTSDEIPAYKEGAKFLSLKIRGSKYEDDETKTLNEAKEKSIRILKEIAPFLKENNISEIQIEWTVPSTLGNGATIEPIYYIIRFDTPTILKMDWNTINIYNVESYASYFDAAKENID